MLSIAVEHMERTGWASANQYLAHHTSAMAMISSAGCSVCGSSLGEDENCEGKAGVVLALSRSSQSYYLGHNDRMFQNGGATTVFCIAVCYWFY